MAKRLKEVTVALVVITTFLLYNLYDRYMDPYTADVLNYTDQASSKYHIDQASSKFCSIRYDEATDATAYSIGKWVAKFPPVTSCGSDSLRQKKCEGNSHDEEIGSKEALCYPERTHAELKAHFNLTGLKPTDRVDYAVAGFRQDCNVRKNRDCGGAGPQSLNRVMEGLRWTWVPDDCKLHTPHNASSWDRVLSKHPILMIGDSTQMDMATVLSCMCELNTSKAYISLQREDNFGVPTKSELNSMKEPPPPPTLEDVIQKATKYLTGHNSIPGFLDNPNSVICFNAGAHWYDSLDRVYRSMRLLGNAFETLFKGTIIFRTNVMGHACCHRFAGPSDLTNDVAGFYNWKMFGNYTETIIRAFSDSNFDNERFKVLDVSMFKIRPDGHPSDLAGHNDCLHYCIPGAASLWYNYLLYHTLVELD